LYVSEQVVRRRLDEEDHSPLVLVLIENGGGGDDALSGSDATFMIDRDLHEISFCVLTR